MYRYGREEEEIGLHAYETGFHILRKKREEAEAEVEETSQALAGFFQKMSNINTQQHVCNEKNRLCRFCKCMENELQNVIAHIIFTFFVEFVCLNRPPLAAHSCIPPSPLFGWACLPPV